MSGTHAKSIRRVILSVAAAVIVGCISPGPNTPLGTLEDPISLSPDRRNYRGTPVQSGRTIGAARVPDYSGPASSAPGSRTSGRVTVDPELEILPAPGEERIEEEGQGPSLGVPSREDSRQEREKPIRTAEHPPKLFLDVRKPESVAVGADVAFDITIRNEGGEAAERVEVFCTFERGLEFPGKKLKTVKRSIGQVAAGDAQIMTLTLVANKVGRQCVQFTVKLDGKEAVWKSVCTTVTQKAISVSIVGPGRRTVESRAEYNVKIVNVSNRSLTGVNATLFHDDVLIPREATEGAEEGDGRLSWNLGDLQPGEGLQLQVEFECARVSDQVKLHAEVNAVEQTAERSEAVMRIVSLPGVLDLRVSDEDDPVAVGQEFFYVVEVRNRGFQSAQDVQVSVSPSPGIRLLDAEIHQGTQRQSSSHQVSARSWEFEPVSHFPAEGRLQIRIHAKAIRPGDHQLRAAVKSDLATTSHTVDELTTVTAK